MELRTLNCQWLPNTKSNHHKTVVCSSLFNCHICLLFYFCLVCYVKACSVLASHPSSVMFLHWTLPSICNWIYFHTSMGHVTWIIKKLIRFLRIVVWQMKVSARLLEVKWLECASLNYSLLCLYNYDYEGQKTYIIKCQLLGLLGTWKWITQRRQTVKMLTTDLSLLSIWVLVMSCVNNTTIWPVNQMM